MNSMRFLILLMFVLYVMQHVQCTIKHLNNLKSILMSKHLSSTAEQPIVEEEVYPIYVQYEPAEEETKIIDLKKGIRSLRNKLREKINLIKIKLKSNHPLLTPIINTADQYKSMIFNQGNQNQKPIVNQQQQPAMTDQFGNYYYGINQLQQHPAMTNQFGNYYYGINQLQQHPAMTNQFGNYYYGIYQQQQQSPAVIDQQLSVTNSPNTYANTVQTSYSPPTQPKPKIAVSPNNTTLLAGISSPESK